MDEVGNHEKAQIIVHHNADPDAVGSAAAFALALKHKGMRVTVSAPLGISRQGRSVLEKYPFLVSLLLEAYVEVGNYFPHSRVFLEVFDDPEVEGMDKLFAYIRTPLPVDEALARLDKLDEEWFLDQLDRAAGRFNFNLEFA